MNKMVRIWLVRHFPVNRAKCYRTKFGCDPAIGNMIENLSLLVKFSLKCGPVEKIISSPYLRCRTTATYIADFLNFNNEIEIDSSIGEFLSRSSREEFDENYLLRTSTCLYNPVFYFDAIEYEEMVRNFLDSCEKKFNGMTNILLVTHSFFLTCIINLLQYPRTSRERPSCICLSVTSQGITVEEFDLLK